MILYGSTENSEDKQLWSDLKKSDELAFAALYNKYVSVLYSYGKKIVNNDEIVEDAIQDLFIDLWQMREGLGDIETARFYLFRSLRRKIHRQYIQKNIPFQNVYDEDERNIPHTCSLEEEMIAGEIAQIETENVRDLLNKLPSRQSEAIMLHYYGNFSFIQIAEILSINEQSARNLIQRALNKLRQISILITFFVYINNLI